MATDREILSRVEKADVPQLVELVSHPDADEERVLRAYFGDTRFRELQDLALRGSTRAVTGKGNVVVLHGIMGGELTMHDDANDDDLLWVSIWRLFLGGFTKLICNDDGSSSLNVTATGILKSYYGKQLVALAGNWNVHAFWYDWRADIKESADALENNINQWFGSDSPVHLVAHSMGGLVARQFIASHPARWKSMWDTAGSGALGGRLIMLGTPNSGSFAIPHLYMGLNSLVNKMAVVDVKHNSDDLLQTAKTFVGTYQMLPSLDKMPDMQRLYESGTYGTLNPLQSRFDRSLLFQNNLKGTIDPKRMVYIGGYNQSTADGIVDWNNLHRMEGYRFTMRGDGTVPHSLGLLDGVTNYFVEEEHGKLPDNADVIAAMDNILRTGTTTTLPTAIPDAVRGVETPATSDAARAAAVARHNSEIQRLQQVVGTMSVRGGSGSMPGIFSRDERLAMDDIMAEFAGTTAGVEFAVTAAAAGAGSGTGTGSFRVIAPPKPAPAPGPPQSVPKITISIVAGSIAEVGETLPANPDPNLPIDAISVGHYADVRPTSAERALSRAISSPLIGEGTDLITQFSERRIIRGNLAQPFYIPDPRTNNGRLIIVAGMGQPGQFSVPELTLLVRELCWSAGRLGKKHLATVLIGSGVGNLEVRDAVDTWLRGIRRACNEAVMSDTPQLQKITFVEADADKLKTLQHILQQAAKAVAQTLEVDLELMTDAEISDYANSSRNRPQHAAAATEAAPTRLIVEMVDGEYRFAAMTQIASVPERTVSINPIIVNQANDALVKSLDEGAQTEFGEVLQRLLIPSELRPHLSTNAPLVITADTTAAQIHWEMMTQPTMDPLDLGSVPSEERFLGLSRGLTRQLKTSFAPVQPSMSSASSLRVLIVADPAADARLPGALEEAKALQQLFESYAQQQSTRSKPRLETLTVQLGPGQATIIDVLKELMLRSYDILHFAGHCVYNKDNPTASGWIFSLKDNLVLSASELNRLDRVPQFVFSNACESGVLPDRAELRSAILAPSFAEAFFSRGVSNFVCTAWPVNDAAARTFATSLYSSLLGIDGSGAPPQPMHKALQQARLAIHGSLGGVRSWGAYQHYGNPYFRLVHSNR